MVVDVVVIYVVGEVVVLRLVILIFRMEFIYFYLGIIVDCYVRHYQWG